MAPPIFDNLHTIPIEFDEPKSDRSAVLDWEPLDIPNPEDMKPKSALTGSDSSH